MIYTNSTTNYTNIDTQKSVHFAVSRTETRLKMHQTCIWNTGHMQSIAGPYMLKHGSKLDLIHFVTLLQSMIQKLVRIVN